MARSGGVELAGALTTLGCGCTVILTKIALVLIVCAVGLRYLGVI